MHKITVQDLVVDVVRKDIKNLHIAVNPPSGRVRVAAPLRVGDEAVRMAVISRLGWIKQRQKKYQDQERQSAREFVSGESHYYRGNRYLLNVVYDDCPQRVEIRNKTTLDLVVRPGSGIGARERVLSSWYRKQIKQVVFPLVKEWEKVIGVRVEECRIRQMKTKWGSCNQSDQRIWLNLELIKKPVQCLEFILVHEMVHLLERHHNDKFKALMDNFMPQWQFHRDELNEHPLRHESWRY